MAETAIYDPIVVEPVLTPLKIRELVERGRESAKLDYKREFDPSDTRARVELAKDLVALGNTAGGYIVIGVADDGGRVGVAAADAARIDEAVVRAQVGAYSSLLPPLFVDNNVTHEGLRYVVITVLPILSSIAVIEVVGNRPGGKAAFRPGDVLVRHGSASEVWNQRDVEFLIRRTTDHKKEEWLRDFRRDLRGLASVSAAHVPVGRTSYDLPAEEFQQTVLDLMRGETGG